jgi:hypothetical protein
MTRYGTGLMGAFLVLGGACAAGMVPVALLRGRPDRFFDFLGLWIALGALSIVGIALIVGPAVLGAQELCSRRFSVVTAAVLGAAFGPALLAVSWLVFRESNETFAGLLQLWARVPGEFIVGVLPNMAASAFFAGWLVRAGAGPEEWLPNEQ